MEKNKKEPSSRYVNQECRTCNNRQLSICSLKKHRIDLCQVCDDWEVLKNIYTGEPYDGGILFTVPITSVKEKALLLCGKGDLVRLCRETGISNLDEIKNNKQKMVHRLANQIDEVGISLQISFYT